MTDIETQNRRAMCAKVKPRKRSRKQLAKLLAKVVHAVGPVYAKHGKQIVGISLPK